MLVCDTPGGIVRIEHPRFLGPMRCRIHGLRFRECIIQGSQMVCPNKSTPCCSECLPKTFDTNLETQIFNLIRIPHPKPMIRL